MVHYAANMLPAMINACHQDALHVASNLELGAMDLRIAVGEVVGKTSTENLLDSIFSQFCIGK